jgi:hypothetical protein
LLFGFIGAFAPCQLSTGVAALSFIARRAADGLATTGGPQPAHHSRERLP